MGGGGQNTTKILCNKKQGNIPINTAPYNTQRKDMDSITPAHSTIPIIQILKRKYKPGDGMDSTQAILKLQNI